jgi:DHA1 family multidrug resistance protein-like MFS transporter
LLTASVSYRKNLTVIFVAEFLAIMSFGFATSFQPLFIQQLGNFDNAQASFWAGVASGGGGIAMFLSAPVWGVIADRWGRKPMVLRALFGAAVLSALLGLVSNIYLFVALRWLQGLLAGTVAAASALVAADAPRHRLPFAMGLLMLAIYSGNSLGPFLGGFLADNIGYAVTFYVTGALLLFAGLLVLFLVKEKFERPVAGREASLASMWHIAVSKDMLPLLIAICALSIGQPMVSPSIPLYFKELDPGIAAATTAGAAFSLMGILTAISSVVSGRLGKRIPLKKIMVVSCIGTGILYLPPMWASTVTQLVIFIALTGLLNGGLMMSASSLVSLSVPRSTQGVAYGLSTSAQSLGAGLGPLIGGSLVSWVGFRPVFGVAGALLVTVGLLLTKMLAKKPAETS